MRALSAPGLGLGTLRIAQVLPLPSFSQLPLMAPCWKFLPPLHKHPPLISCSSSSSNALLNKEGKKPAFPVCLFFNLCIFV